MKLIDLFSVLTQPSAEFILGVENAEITSIHIVGPSVHGGAGEYVRVHFTTADGREERVLLGQHTEHHDQNTGLPCVHCGLKQKRIEMEWRGDELTLCVSTKIKREDSKGEINGLVKLMKMLVRP